MVSAKLLQIFATGPQDKILYGNPKITYFKTVYKQHTNFGSNYVVKDLSSYAGFGKTLRFKVPREGDLLGATYIRFGLSLKNTAGTNPYYSSFCNGIGSVLIEEIGLYVGGKRLESFPGEWIMLDNEIYNDNSRKKEFYKMIGYKDFEFNIGTHSPSYDVSTGTVSPVRNQEGDNLGDIDILVPIPFFYTKDTGFYLPVCAMNEENIEIVLKLRNSADCIVKNINSADAAVSANFRTDEALTTNSSIDYKKIIDEQVNAQITSMEIIYNYYYLDDREKQYFMNNDHRYIIPIAKQGIKNNFNYVSNSQSMKTTLDIKHPVKFITWTLQRESLANMNDYFNYTYSPTVGDDSNGYYYETIPDPDRNMVNTFNFDIDGHPLLDKLPSKILNSAELYSKFKNNSNLLFYLYSFSLHPRDIYPSGTLNFSRIKDTDIKFTLSDKSSQANDAQVDIPNYTSDKFIMTPYTVYYNILSIKDGLSGLEFI